ncbi:MAG: hypothetical protein ACOYD7_05100 [Raoultibacter sp.]
MQTYSENDVVWGALEVLRSYIEESPAVEFTNDTIVVPSMAQEYFNGLFDTVASMVAAEAVEESSISVEKLRVSLAKAEQNFMLFAAIDRVEIPAALRDFLASPVRAMCKVVAPLILEYLKASLSYSELMCKVLQRIEAEMHSLWCCGYEYWVYFALLNELKPRQIYRVMLDEEGRVRKEKAKTLKPGQALMYEGVRYPDALLTTKFMRHYAISFELRSDIEQMRGVDPFAAEESAGALNTFSVGRRCLIVYELEAPEIIPALAPHTYCAFRRPSFSVEIATAEELNQASHRRACENRARLLEPETGHFTVVPSSPATDFSKQVRDTRPTLSQHARVMSLDYNIAELYASVSSFAPYYGTQKRYAPAKP